MADPEEQKIIVSRPYRMFEKQFSNRRYYNDHLLQRYDGTGAEHLVYEGSENVSGDDWELDDECILGYRTREAVTMFCVFDFTTKELIKNAVSGKTQFYTSLARAYEDQNDVAECAEDFNKKFLIFEVPDLKKDEVVPDVMKKPNTFVGALKKSASGWSTT